MILIGIAVLMIVMGIVMQSGKGGFLISGYNTMPKEQQAQVDLKGLSKLLAFYGYFLALVFLGMAVCEWLNWPTGLIVCVVILLLSTVVVIVTSQKFYAQVTYTGTGKFGKGAKWSGIISIVVLVGVSILLYFSVQPTAIIVTGDELTIGGMYGDTVALADVSALALLEEMPAISIRTNGSAFGSKLTGHFKLENGEKVKLFIDKRKPPFITFIAGSKRYYLNETTSEKTTALFEQMKSGK